MTYIPPYNARRLCPEKNFHWEVKVNLFWTAGNLKTLTAAQRTRTGVSTSKYYKVEYNTN